MDLATLVDKVQAAGIVGAGGAGFPTHVKLNNRCETVLVNAAECEPLLQVDQQLLKQEAQALVKTLALVVEATGAGKGIFGVKAKYEAALAILEQAVAALDLHQGKLEIARLGDFYPAGDEQVLVYEVLGQVVPQGGIPLQVGVIVLNVETLLNISRALNHEAVTHKYVTVAGAVANPVTVKVPLGTPINSVLGLAGGSTVEHFRVLEGGPMMGKEVYDLERGVTKTTKGLIVLPAEHRLWRKKDVPSSTMLKRAMSVCCQCSACTDLCPRHLLGHTIEPHRILRSLVHHVGSDFKGLTGAQFCSECAVCDVYACVMDISPRQLNAAVKRELGKQGFRQAPGGEGKPSSQRELRKIPIKRLIPRLGLESYHKPAPLSSREFEPDQVRLELKQHVGLPCTPVVEPGARVTAGVLVAEVPSGQLGSRIHASIAGTVLQVAPQIVIAR